MSTIRVIGGSLKGRKIPFDNKKFKNADITTQKVKGAVFSMLGEDLYGTAFLDLYGGSGQIGLEALSRGSRIVIINEKDKERYEFLKSFIYGVDKMIPVMLLNLSAYKCIRYFIIFNTIGEKMITEEDRRISWSHKDKITIKNLRKENGFLGIPKKMVFYLIQNNFSGSKYRIRPIP